MWLLGRNMSSDTQAILAWLLDLLQNLRAFCLFQISHDCNLTVSRRLSPSLAVSPSTQILVYPNQQQYATRLPCWKPGRYLTSEYYFPPCYNGRTALRTQSVVSKSGGVIVFFQAPPRVSGFVVLWEATVSNIRIVWRLTYSAWGYMGDTTGLHTHTSMQACWLRCVYAYVLCVHNSSSIYNSCSVYR